MTPGFGWAMEWSACDDLDPSIVGELEDDVVVDKVKRAVERTDSHFRRPIELDLVKRQSSLTGHGLPGGPVVLVADEGGDDAVLVDLADVSSVGDEHFSVNSNSDS